MPILGRDGNVRRKGLLLGPILYVDQADPETWRFSVGMLLDGKASGPPVEVVTSLGTVRKPVLVADFTAEVGACFWRWPVEVDRKSNSTKVTYTIKPAAKGGAGIARATFGPVHVPGADELPRIGFFSCNVEAIMEKRGGSIAPHVIES